MDGTRKAVWTAFGCNLAIAAAKALGAWSSASTSLFAEALHSVVDSCNQIFLYLGLRLQERKPTEQHPFGFGHERYFWGFVAAAFIFVSGALVSLYEGVTKWLHPHALQDPRWGVASLAFSFAMEGWSFWVGWRELARKASHARQPTLAYLRTSRDPTLMGVVLEDSAALVGLTMASAGLGLSFALHDPRWDGAGSFGVGLVLVVMAFTLAARSRGLLLGMAASPRERRRIRATFREADTVLELIDCYTLQLGPRELMLAAHVRLKDGLDTRGVARVIDDLEADLKRAVPELGKIFIEVENLKDLKRKRKLDVPL